MKDMRVTKHLLDWLRKRMREHSLTIAGLAVETGVSAASWSRLLNGYTKKLNPETVEALCRWQNMTQEQLLRIGSGQPVDAEAINTGIVYPDAGLRSGVEWLIREGSEADQAAIRSVLQALREAASTNKGADNALD